MKFRRHRPERARIDWGKLRARLLAPIQRLPSLERVLGERGTPKRNWLVGGSAITAMFAFGYVFAAVWLFPAPVFPRTQQVPRVLGQRLAEAQEALEATRLVVSDTELLSHPEIEPGHVVWQDPPPQMAVPQGTGVALWISRGPRPVPVPDVSGYERELAARLIEAAGLRVARIDTTVAPQERGVVVNTRPPAGQSRDPGDGVTLFVSVGTPSISVPDLAGLNIDEAREVLEELGLVLGSTRTRRTTAADSGLIIEQDPAAGTLSAPGASVNVIIVRGERS